MRIVRGEAAFSGGRGEAPEQKRLAGWNCHSPWAKAPSGKNESGEAAFSGERGDSPWAKAPSGKNGAGEGIRTLGLFLGKEAL
jgi:hypothetical protein